MRVTIIPSDNLVIIDGEARGGLSFEIDPTIHVVQWYETSGEVEYKTDTERNKPPNSIITDLTEFQSAIDAWNNYVPPAPPPIVPEIKTVTMRQARLALYDANLLGQVQSAVDQSPTPIQIEWEYATIVQRNSPLVMSLGAALNLDDAGIDALFEVAQTY